MIEPKRAAVGIRARLAVDMRRRLLSNSQFDRPQVNAIVRDYIKYLRSSEAKSEDEFAAESEERVKPSYPSFYQLARKKWQFLDKDEKMLKWASDRKLPSDEQLLDKVRELERLARYATSPSNPNSMGEKDANARLAIKLAGELIGPLIKWAISHQAGQVKFKTGPALDWSAIRLSNPELYARTRIRNLSANDHNNEIVGAEYDGSDPLTNRRLIARTLSLLSQGMQFKPGLAVAAAIHALDQGERPETLTPSKIKRGRRPASVDELHLLALQHVWFRRGSGMTRDEALSKVADGLACTEEAIKKWEKELPDLMDPELFFERTYRSRMCGQLKTALETGLLPEQVAKELPLTDLAKPETRNEIKQMAKQYDERGLFVIKEKLKELKRGARGKRATH